MTWYVIIFDREGKIQDYFWIKGSFKDILDEIATRLKSSRYFAIFTDRRAFFILLIKKSWTKDIIEGIAKRSTLRDIPAGYWDFIGDYIHRTNIFWIFYPGRGAFRIDRQLHKVRLYEFLDSYDESNFYEDLKRIFSVRDLEKILQERRK